MPREFSFCAVQSLVSVDEKLKKMGTKKRRKRDKKGGKGKARRFASNKSFALNACVEDPDKT